MIKRIIFSALLAIFLVGAIVFLNTLTIGDSTNKLSGFAIQEESVQATNTVLQEQKEVKTIDETSKDRQESTAASANFDVSLRIVE